MKKFKIGACAGIVVAALIYLFVKAPTINPLYPEGAFFWCMLITAFTLVWVIARFGSVFTQAAEQATSPSLLIPFLKLPKLPKLLLLAPWALFFAVVIGSSVFFHWKAYRDQLGEPILKKFSSEIQVVDTNQIPVVDRALATKLADKKLGEKPSLGSQVYLGEPVIQMVNGKLVWVVPLHHSGVFKWLTNMSGTPGYVVVSATNVNDVQYVEDYKIKYHPGSYLLHDLNRHIRLSGEWAEGITDDSFELDDNGQPYWVVTTYRYTRGFALPEATGAILVNATTGEMEKYSIDEMPEWVDRVQPEDFILQQIRNKGEYVNGIFNFSDKDKYRPSEGHNVIYNNGDCYLFTGLTSVGSDESAIGFIMVNMVTKEPHLYQMNGATEEAGRSSAEGKVQHLGYRASFPIILNVDGQPTYFMPLKDAEGLIKQYAFVNINSYSSVGVGETIQAAMRDYRVVMSGAGMNTDFNESGELSAIQGTVVRIASEYNGSETVYKLLLSEESGKIFTVTAGISQELALTQPGDMVSLSYYDVGGPICQGESFDNLSIGEEPVEPELPEENTPENPESQPDASSQPAA